MFWKGRFFRQWCLMFVFSEPLPFGIACNIPISPWLLPCQVLPSVGSAMHELLGRMTANGSGGVASLAINPGTYQLVPNWFTSNKNVKNLKVGGWKLMAEDLRFRLRLFCCPFLKVGDLQAMCLVLENVPWLSWLNLSAVNMSHWSFFFL